MTLELMEKILCNVFLINLAFSVVWAAMIMLFSDWAYNLHLNFFAIDKKDWFKMNYVLMGFYKIMLILFVLGPWLALKML